MTRDWNCTRFAAALLLLSLPLSAMGEEKEAKPTPIAIANGAITLQAPAGWEKKQPANNIIDVEFAVPKVEGDEADGRLTIMRAGGSVEDNIGRWMGQFSQPDDAATRERAVVSEEEVAGQKVHLVDVSGTYSDSRGPRFPAVQRENYRMLAAIVVTEDHGQQFIKLYGPRKTIAANEEGFKEFVKSLKVK